MKLVCVIKFVPDVDPSRLDHHKPNGIRGEDRMRINPDDLCALGFALTFKKANPDTYIELVSLPPHSAKPLNDLISQVEDCLRVGIDRATIISDPSFAGSNALTVASILSRYLGSTTFDAVLTGTRAIDDGSGSVPASIAELLGLGHMTGISEIGMDRFDGSHAVATVQDRGRLETYQLELPAVLSFSDRGAYRLPYVRLKDQHQDVSGQLILLDNKQLGFSTHDVGTAASHTAIVDYKIKPCRNKAPLMVSADETGVETVFNFLKQNRFI